jgi:hypothetical protein
MRLSRWSVSLDNVRRRPNEPVHIDELELGQVDDDFALVVRDEGLVEAG